MMEIAKWLKARILKTKDLTGKLGTFAVYIVGITTSILGGKTNIKLPPKL